MAWDKKIYVSHATYTNGKTLDKRIKSYDVHMRLPLPIGMIENLGCDVLDAIYGLARKEEEYIEKCNLVAVFTVGPKTWQLKLSMPSYLYMTEDYVEGFPEEALLFGSDLRRMPEKVVEYGFVVSEAAATVLLKNLNKQDKIAFNVAKTLAKQYKIG